MMPIEFEKEQPPSAWVRTCTAARDTTKKIYERTRQTRPSTLLKLFTNRTSAPCVPNAKRTASRTASYDGLRGLACLIVFNFHFLYPYTRTITHGFAAGRDDDDSHRNFHQLPIICLLVRGRAMVTLFFAISGYVLSYNFLASMRNSKWIHGFGRLSSLTLRRWARLYLPATISMSLVCLGAFFGAFEPGREFQESEWLTGLWEQHPPKFESFGAQLRDFFFMWWDWSTPFQWRLYYSLYDPHTWTIPVEFKGSMVLFILLVAAAGLKQGWRIGLVVLVTIFCFASQRWEVATFTGGALVAELHLIAAARQEKSCALPLDEKAPAPKIPSQVRKYAIILLKSMVFVFSLYVLSFPDDAADTTPGFWWLNRITPPIYNQHYLFWHAFAALFVIWSIETLSLMRKFLSLSFPQYLGKISYGLYLVHGPLLHSAGFAMQPKIWQTIGHDTMVKWVGGLVLGWLTMLILSIVAAHLFYKLVDAPLVRATKWVEGLAREKEAFTSTTGGEKRVVS